MKEKPVREMDSILIRVPDGVKEKLTLRARANGRSLNQELVSLISALLDIPDEMALRELETQREELAREERDAKARLTAIQRKQTALNEEIMSIYQILENARKTEKARKARKKPD